VGQRSGYWCYWSLDRWLGRRKLKGLKSVEQEQVSDHEFSNRWATCFSPSFCVIGDRQFRERAAITKTHVCIIKATAWRTKQIKIWRRPNRPVRNSWKTASADSLPLCADIVLFATVRVAPSRPALADLQNTGKSASAPARHFKHAGPSSAGKSSLEHPDKVKLNPAACTNATVTPQKRGVFGSVTGCLGGETTADGSEFRSAHASRPRSPGNVERSGAGSLAGSQERFRGHPSSYFSPSSSEGSPFNRSSLSPFFNTPILKFHQTSDMPHSR
jgi:hypothetical protein